MRGVSLSGFNRSKRKLPCEGRGGGHGDEVEGEGNEDEGSDAKVWDSFVEWVDGAHGGDAVADGVPRESE